MSTQPDTLYDRAWHALTGRREPWGGCAERETVDRIVALVLAETTTAQPEADAVERAALAEAWQRGMMAGRSRWMRNDDNEEYPPVNPYAAQPVEPEPFMPGPGHAAFCGNEQPHARHRHPLPDSYDVCEGVPPVEPEPDERRMAEWCRENGLPLTFIAAVLSPEPGEREALLMLIYDRTLNSADLLADAILAAGFRRSRPEATHTVTAEQREAAWQVLARHGVSAALPSILAALGVTVADTPTQEG